MQTFLPYPSYSQSAECLDNKRLGKQRVEAKQLLLALGIPVGDHLPKRSSWVNHPAAKMWRGCEVSLCLYAMHCCMEWRLRGYRDNLWDQFLGAENYIRSLGRLRHPDWLGDEAFHASHRSNLLRKDPVHYGQFGWLESPDLPYVWPSQSTADATA